MAAVVVTAAMAGTLLAPPLANAASPSVTVDASPVAASAQRAASAAHAYRTRATHLMRGYQARFGGRLTPTERARVETLTSDGLAALRTLDARAQRTANLARTGASTARINRARQEALDAHTQATTQLQAAITELQPLLARHLGLFEALQAKEDLDQAMRDLEALGTALESIPRAR